MRYFNDADYKNLWKTTNTKEVSIFNPMPFPSDEELAALETRLGVKLPSSYIELAKTSQNGGHTKRNSFPLCGDDGNVYRHIEIPVICPMGYHSFANRGLGSDSPSLLYDMQNLVKISQSFVTYYDFIVLNYLDCTPNEEPSVAFVTRKVRNGKDGEPPLDCKNWRHINDKFYWELKTIAPTFDVFIKGLVVMPKLPPFKFEDIKEPLKTAAQKAFREAVKKHGNEEIIAFGLYIDPDGTMVDDAINTKENLERNLAEYGKSKSDTEYFTYSTSEWKYSTFALDLFEPISKELAIRSAALGSEDKMTRFSGKLFNFCVDILAELKAENFFSNEYNLPIMLSVGIEGGELSPAKIKKIRTVLE